VDAGRAGAACAQGAAVLARKVFFFEKKKQKTFSLLCSAKAVEAARHNAHNEQKFFGSFFQKRTFAAPGRSQH
jgi:hypothetical protein